MGLVRKLVMAVTLLCVISCSHSQNVTNEYEKISNSNTIFASRLYQELSRNSSNLVFSPLSVSVALSMLCVGANGNTFQELNHTLGFDDAHMDEQELLQEYQTLYSTLTGSSDGYEFSLANAQYVDQNFPIHENYSRVLTEDFHAESKLENFTNQVQTLQNINGWVDRATRGKITEILEKLDPLAVMVLLNAVYFKAEWQTMFEKDQTTDVDFFKEDGTRKQVKFMNRLVPCLFSRNHPLGGSVLELPYKGNTFSMILVLPEINGNLSSLEEKLTPEALALISDGLELQNVTVGMPKMKLDSKVDLIPHLQSLGIHDAFEDHANLRRISPAPLKVSQAVHKAVMEWSEEGAEASAATAIVTSTRTGNIRPYFWANRPFFFMLRHNPTKTICFMGRVVDIDDN